MSGTKRDCFYLNHGLMITPDSELRPCCRFDTQVHSDSFHWDQKENLISYAKRSPLQNLKIQDTIAGCHKCYREEDSGQKSMRNKVSVPRPGMVKDDDCIFLEVSSGRICNLKCRSCNAKYSTKWDEDLKKLGLDAPTNVAQFDLSLIPDEYLKTVQVLKISGGEPLLHRQLISFFERILDNRPKGDLCIEFYTNGSIVPTDRHIELLRKFEKVDIAVSVDDTEARNTYLRPPLLWEDFNQVFKAWSNIADNDRIHLRLATTISLFNCLSVLSLLQWRDQLRVKPDLVFQFVHDPEYMSLFFLPNTVREKISEVHQNRLIQIGNHFDLEKPLVSRLKKLTDIITTPAKNPVSLEVIEREIKKLDEIRNESFAETFPEMNELLFLSV